MQAVDLFWVRDRVDGSSGVARAMAKLERDLRRVMTEQVSPRELGSVAGRSSPWSERPAPAVQTEVSIDNRASSAQTVIEILTRDRPGILFELAQALHDLKLSIALAKINTEGNRVADVFYVTEENGSKIEAPARIQEVRATLIGALDDLARSRS